MSACVMTCTNNLLGNKSEKKVTISEVQVHPIPENVVHLIFQLSTLFQFGDYGISQLSTDTYVLSY